MNRILLGIFAVALCFTVAQTLQCYNCDLGIFNLCINTKTTCADGEFCYTGDGKAAGLVDVKMKGCLKAADCNKTTTTTYGPISNSSFYTVTKTCCGSDLCNTAAGLPNLHTLTLALVSVTSVFITKVLL